MPRYIERRRRLWYARLRVPDDVRDQFGGKLRLIQSLGTEDRTVAERKVLPVISKWKSQIARARREAHGEERDPVHSEAMDWRRAYLEAEDEGEREAILEHVADLATDFHTGFRRLPGGRVANPEDKAEEFYQTATGEKVRLREHLDDYLDAPTTSMTDKSAAQVQADLKRLSQEVEWLHEVNRKTVQGWVEKLMSKDGLSKATIQRTLSSCRNYWRYLVRRELVPQELANPFSEIDLGAKRGRNGPRRGDRAFEATDVVKLLAAADDKGDQKLADLIRLAMWTGCRREELCALKTDKVDLEGKIPAFEIEDAKTEAGWRQVPIHSALLPTMTRLVEDAKDGYVLSGLSAANKNNVRGDAVGKKFSRLKTDQGFDGRYVFHSIRKTVVTLLDNAEVPVVVIAELVGHERPTFTQQKYFGGATMERKRAAIEKLAYSL